MTEVRIFKPAKTAMQSGRRNTRDWILEYEPEAAKVIDPLMGWTGSHDTRDQVRVRFASREDAVAFAERRGLAYRVQEPQAQNIRPKSYAENFRFDKVE